MSEKLRTYLCARSLLVLFERSQFAGPVCCGEYAIVNPFNFLFCAFAGFGIGINERFAAKQPSGKAAQICSIFRIKKQLAASFFGFKCILHKLYKKQSIEITKRSFPF